MDTYRLASRAVDDPESFFLWNVTTLNGNNIAVFRPRDRDRYLFLRAGWVLSEEEQKKVAALSAEEAKDLIGDLRVEMARYKISFTGIALPLQRINVGKNLPINGSLTEDRFTDAIDEVELAIILVRETLAKKLNPGPKGPSQ